VQWYRDLGDPPLYSGLGLSSCAEIGGYVRVTLGIYWLVKSWNGEHYGTHSS
jgi:hypothetical protein